MEPEIDGQGVDVTTVPPVVEIPEPVITPEPESRENERIRELNERVKNAEGLVAMQAQTIQSMQRPPAPPPEEEDPLLDPVLKQTRLELRQTQAAFGQLADQNDVLLARTNPDIKDYAKYEGQVNSTLADLRRSGRNSDRTSIYWWLKGQEAGKARPGNPPVKKEEETPAPIPETRRAVQSGAIKKKPMTLEEEAESLKNEPV